MLALWILAALWAGNTLGATFPILADLRSSIFADYSSDILGRTLKSLQLSILGDLTIGPGSGDNSDVDWTGAFQDPVPSATHVSERINTTETPGQGEPTEVAAPAVTETLEPTHTDEPMPPTAIPAATDTPKPTSTPSPEATSKPRDFEAPILSGGILSPPSGEMSVCEALITVTDLEVEDHPWSSGINWVKLKYKVEGYSDYIYSHPMSLESGGPTGDGGWSGCYSGEVLVQIDPGWPSPEPETFNINLWAKARDNAGHEGYLWLGEYTMLSSCGGKVE